MPPPFLFLNIPLSGINSAAVSAMIDGAKKGSNDLITKALAAAANKSAVS